MISELSESESSDTVNQIYDSRPSHIDAVFWTDPLVYHKFENMVIFRSRILYELCSLGYQDDQKIIYFLFFRQKGRNRQCKSCIFIGIINES